MKKIRSNGEKVWSFYDEPLVKTPALNLDSDHIDNVFIPNPVDGTLFKFHTGQPVQVQIQEKKNNNEEKTKNFQFLLYFI